MVGKAFMNACIFGVISYINFFVLSPSFLKILIGIMAGFVALASVFFGVMMAIHGSSEEPSKKILNNETDKNINTD